MGSLEVRNLLLSKKLKLSETRLLIIDDNQIRYNQIIDIFQSKNHLVQATLLDDLKSFEKQLHTDWDLIIFGRAYDLKLEQTLALIQASECIDIPVILLKPDHYHPEQYQSYIHKGVYDVLNFDYLERFYIGLIRALSYSRSLQTQRRILNDLDNAKNQTQALVEHQQKAVATIQEGIHIQANSQYLKLFGLRNEDDVLGLPLLDILQPQDLNEFKNRFKKISQGQFEFSRFEIDTLNQHALHQNPLKLEFLASDEDDAVCITIEMPQQPESHHKKTDINQMMNHDLNLDENPSFQKIQRALIQQPANANALVLFSLSSCPTEILHLDWNSTKEYFQNVKNFIKQQTQHTIFRLDTALYAILLQAESEHVLESRLLGLRALEKPQLIQINQKNFPLQLKLGYSILDLDCFTASNFKQILAKTYDTNLLQLDINLNQQSHNSADQNTIELTLLDDSSQPTAIETQVKSKLSLDSITPENAILEHIQQKLELNEIQLKYQQLYDKEDQNLYIYEASSGFIYENEWKSHESLIELDRDIELSIKLDRWILVEASKQLHNFIMQNPDAKLIVNLNRHILLHDTQFPELVSKLITIIGSHHSHPLILQFDENDIARNIIDAQKKIQKLREHGAEISIRNFGTTSVSQGILEQVELSYIALHEKYTHMLSKDAEVQKLQQLIERYHAIRPLEFLLKNLNDMNAFANAWNVEIRYLQGDYFQKKLDHLTDVQGQ